MVVDGIEPDSVCIKEDVPLDPVELNSEPEVGLEGDLKVRLPVDPISVAVLKPLQHPDLVVGGQVSVETGVKTQVLEGWVAIGGVIGEAP